MIQVNKRNKKNSRKIVIYVVRELRDYLSEIKGNKKWDLYWYHDHGERSTDARCATCGTSLRHEFVIRNKKTKEKMSLGSDHLVQKLNIPDYLASRVFQRIEYFKATKEELEEKYMTGFKLDSYYKENLGLIHVNKEIQRLLDADLPLLDKHIEYLEKQIPLAIARKKRQEKMIIHGSEIKDKTVYRVAVGEIDSVQFFEGNYSNIIFELLNKHRTYYVQDYEIMDHLVKKGLPYEVARGQHVLMGELRKYLKQQKGVVNDIDIDGYWRFGIP
jgi:hypothetical protein